MRAVVQTRYGGTDRLRIEERPDPAPGAREVLVRVQAAGIDRGTWHLMTGRPYAARVVGGLRRPRVPVAGRDVAGVVEAVGAEVIGAAVGDEVIGTAAGSFAELAVVPESRLAAKPATVSFAEAAVLPVSGVTALQALRDAGRLRAGQRVLVIGASGGVGTFAVQLAVALGGEVAAVASRHKADLVRSLGASEVIDYASEEVDARGPRYDLVSTSPATARSPSCAARSRPRAPSSSLGATTAAAGRPARTVSSSPRSGPRSCASG